MICVKNWHFATMLVSEPLGLLPSNVWSAKQNQRNRNLIADNLFIKRHRLNVTDQRYAGGCAGSTNDRSWAIAGWACKYIFTSKSNPPSLSVKLSLLSLMKKKNIHTIPEKKYWWEIWPNQVPVPHSRSKISPLNLNSTFLVTVVTNVQMQASLHGN